MATSQSDAHARPSPISAPPANPIDGREAWFRLLVSVMLATIGCAGMWIVVVILPTVQAEFGTSRAGATLPFTLMTFGFALGNVVGGRYVDRFGITIPAVAASFALGAGFIGAAYSTSIWQFAIIHGVFIGTGVSITFGPLIANISHWFDRRRGIAVAVAASGNYIAGALWPSVTQGFIATEGWRATYTGLGIFCVVTMVPLALLLRKASPAENRHGSTGTVPIETPRYFIDVSPKAFQMLLSIAGVACCVAMAMPQVHIVAYCADLGFGVEMLSLMLGAGIISRLASGFLADYVGGVRTALLGSVLQCLALVFFLPFDGLMSLYVLSFMFGLAQGGIIPCYAIIIREYLPAAEAGRRIGLVIMATILGMALGGWLSGWIFDLTGSYRSAFINGIAWNFLNIGIFVLILWRTQRALMARAWP